MIEKPEYKRIRLQLEYLSWSIPDSFLSYQFLFFNTIGLNTASSFFSFTQLAFIYAGLQREPRRSEEAENRVEDITKR